MLAFGIAAALVVIGVISKRTKAALQAHLAPTHPSDSDS
jgi:hypothetical protein